MSHQGCDSLNIAPVKVSQTLMSPTTQLSGEKMSQEVVYSMIRPVQPSVERLQPSSDRQLLRLLSGVNSAHSQHDWRM